MISLSSDVIKYVMNILWMLTDKFSSMFATFALTIIIARYYGPEEFGIYAYAISIAAIVSSAGHMGLNGLIVRELVQDKENNDRILSTVFILKSLVFCLAYLCVAIYAYIFESYNQDTYISLMVASLVILFLPFDVFDYWFQAQVKSKYTALSRVVSQLTAFILKLTLVLSGFSILYVLAINIFQSAIFALLLICFYFKVNGNVITPKYDHRFAVSMLKQGFPIYLGAIFAMVYLKIDQVMIKWMLSSEDVGYYAVASQLSEAWYFIPTAIVSSYFPKFIHLRKISEREFNNKFQSLLDILFWIAVIVALIVTFTSEHIISLLFGDRYLISSSVLSIHIWAAVFIFMRSAFSRWILIENALFFSMFTQGAGALMNIGCNYYMIPIWGIEGAAYATLISYASASFFSLYIYKKTRHVFYMMINTLTCPFRVLKG
jgi:O-antigen/teichoic acid export membrane protein